MATKTDLRGGPNGDLLEKTVVAHLATRRADGSMQSNPVWFDWDGIHIRLSTLRTRQKMRNLEHDPHLALSITDPQNPYRYLEIRGVVDRVEEDPDRVFIDGLSARYMGKTPYPYHRASDQRVVVYVRPTGSSAMAA